MHYVSAKSMGLFQAITRTVAILILGVALFHFIDSSSGYTQKLGLQKDVKELHSFHESHIVCEAVNGERKKVMKVRQTKVVRVFMDGKTEEEIELDTLFLGVKNIEEPCPVESSPNMAYSSFQRGSLAGAIQWEWWLDRYGRIFQE